ncbi:hypothetical protein ACF08W_12255 [Streptomyces sp. NPDC015144]|uniref:hypothetical protein n=1 Tax=Streptomyces sp. NPDC015144 TaxID=3364944 RepID=UPI003700DC10
MSPHQHLPASVLRASQALRAAAVLAVVGAGVVVADQAVDGGLGQHLHRAYPHRSADQLAMAESSILTYLFTLAAFGTVLFAAMAWAGRRGRRWVRSVGGATLVLGCALAVYNFSQPHPLVMTLAGILPCAAGLVAVALLWTRESSAFFTSARATTA